jgi:SAM-dependent methyltransferase
VIRRIVRVLRDPGKVPCYLRYRWNVSRVRRVETDAGIHFAFGGDLYPERLNVGNACSFIAEKALGYCRGRGIDVGASEWPLPGAIPVRDEPHQNAYKLDSFPDGSLDFVFTSHCLEHLARWRDALDLWIEKLKPGGILFLYLPHESMKMWRRCGPWVGLGHQWIPTWEVLVPLLQDRGMEIVEHNPGRDGYWSFHIAARRR